ncbi:MAG TPA: hypothetical protein VKS25_09535 [Solirubrobacteraceae bacterium]|nr:hypothetical protein [Solirubrobacteraceae bacterium]
MSRTRHARSVVAVGALAALVLAVHVAVSPAAGVACGAQTVPTIATLDGRIATNIYGGELGGSETMVDLGHVKTAPDLLSAVAAGDAAATMAAVKRIVYHPFWHIVRLRVLSPAGVLLADFGGPFVISPVDGALVLDGRTIGSFVMSVQDDVGFTKLETHAIGDPIAIYVSGHLVAELGGAFPKAQPLTARLRLGGLTYALQNETYDAFPTGTLTAVLAIPTPPASLKAESCAAVTVAEIKRVVLRIAARYHPLAARYNDFVETAHADTGVLVIVRIGLRVIAGSAGPGPLVIPDAGSVSYLGRVWSVFSLAPTPPARVYVLVPAPP